MPAPHSHTKLISGRNQFIRSNRPRLLAGLQPILDGPVTPGLPDSPHVTGEIYPDDSTLAIAWLATDTWYTTPGSYLLVFDGRPSNDTINTPVETYRLSGVIPQTTPVPNAALPNVWNAQSPMRGWFRVSATYPDGRLSL